MPKYGAYCAWGLVLGYWAALCILIIGKRRRLAKDVTRHGRESLVAYCAGVGIEVAIAERISKRVLGRWPYREEITVLADDEPFEQFNVQEQAVLQDALAHHRYDAEVMDWVIDNVGVPEGDCDVKSIAKLVSELTEDKIRLLMASDEFS
jgi:hypothetical protein